MPRIDLKILEIGLGVRDRLDFGTFHIFTESTAFWVMVSIRLDLGYGSQVHP